MYDQLRINVMKKEPKYSTNNRLESKNSKGSHASSSVSDVSEGSKGQERIYYESQYYQASLKSQIKNNF